jgi:protein TonB
MEAKKDPNKDVHRQSFKFFFIGLGISVSLAITAFEWTTKKNVYPDKNFETIKESYIHVLPITHEPLKAIPIEEKKTLSPWQTITPTTLPDYSIKDNVTIELPEENFIDLNSGIGAFDLPPEDTTRILLIAEVQPKPVGGYESYYGQLSKNLKYPRQAIRQHVDGRVYVEFVVDRNGTVSQVKVIKGIGAGCDEEAMRVLTLTKWEPGKQRGRPVNVRMIIPVIFKVN